MPATKAVLTPQALAERILIVRGQRVMLDSDLAQLYEVDTRRLNEQVKRNSNRFPIDFAFQLSRDEFEILMSQFATSRWGGRRKLPYVFTEHGALMAAAVLNSDSAVEMSLYVVRAFIQLRDLLSSHKALAQKLDQLERRVTHHDNSLVEIIEAIRALMAQPPTGKRPIGFTADLASTSRNTRTSRSGRK